MAEVEPQLPSDYADVLGRLNEEVRTAQMRAQRWVDTELIQLYWSIGVDLGKRHDAEGWRSNTVTRVADDLRAEFPAIRGFSRSNLFAMPSLARPWPSENEIQQGAGLPRGHIVSVIDKLTDQASRDQYAAAAVANE